mmetsp:Transcript_16465/g.45620  ORF Transcript_16465/g.45620 Transcript_16465/m.45620 type:complete len:234 (-) Transcript_16465:49-750(-)
MLLFQLPNTRTEIIVALLEGDRLVLMEFLEHQFATLDDGWTDLQVVTEHFDKLVLDPANTHERIDTIHGENAELQTCIIAPRALTLDEQFRARQWVDADTTSDFDDGITPPFICLVVWEHGGKQVDRLWLESGLASAPKTREDARHGVRRAAIEHDTIDDCRSKLLPFRKKLLLQRFAALIHPFQIQAIAEHSLPHRLAQMQDDNMLDVAIVTERRCRLAFAVLPFAAKNDHG